MKRSRISSKIPPVWKISSQPRKIRFQGAKRNENESSFVIVRGSQVSGGSIFVKGGEKGAETREKPKAVSTFDHVCLALRTWSTFFPPPRRPRRNFAHMPGHWRVESAPVPRANYRWPRVTTSGPLSPVTSLA